LCRGGALFTRPDAPGGVAGIRRRGFGSQKKSIDALKPEWNRDAGQILTSDF
jgi:hypothetical protein